MRISDWSSDVCSSDLLHPLDQFRAMRAMVDKGQDIESIAAHFLVTPAVVSQRLKLAKVSPRLHEVYAEDGMTLERSEEHTSELQSLMRISYAVFCLKKKKKHNLN